VSGPSALIDTNIFVSARNRNEAGHAVCSRLLDLIDDGRIQAMVSTISIAEIRSGMSVAEARNVWQAFVSHLLTSPHYEVEPVDVEIAQAAGELRERTKLTLPDALIIATGQLRGAAYVVTQDRQLGRLQTALGTRAPEQLG